MSPAGAAAPDGARQRLPARADRRRAVATTSASATSPRCASSRCSGWPTRSRGRCSSTAPSTASTGTWETRERVVVALTGGPEGETLLRRGARIAARAVGGELLAVHVARSDGLTGANPAALAAQRALVESLGGTLPPGRRRRHHRRAAGVRPRARTPPSSCSAPAAGPGSDGSSGRASARGSCAESGDIDVHIVTHSAAGTGRGLPIGRRRHHRPAADAGLRARGGAAGRCSRCCSAEPACAAQPGQRRRWCSCSPSCSSRWSAGSGRRCARRSSARCCSTTTSSPPLHTFTINEHNNVLALLVFVAVAVLVSLVVDSAARRTRQAARAAAESELLSTIAGQRAARRGLGDGAAGAGPGGVRDGLRDAARADRRTAPAAAAEWRAVAWAGNPCATPGRGRHRGAGRRPAHAGAVPGVRCRRRTAGSWARSPRRPPWRWSRAG